MTHDRFHALRVAAVVLAGILAVAQIGDVAAAGRSPNRPGPSVKPQHVPIAVFGTDDRVAVPQHLEGLSEKVGLLFNNRARTVCSAFCVAENMVATAAHCLGKGPSSANVRYSDFVFARNYDRRQEYSKIEGASTGAAAQNIVSGDFKLRVRPPIDAANDWAIIKLQKNGCPAGGIPVRPLAIGELIEASRDKRVFQFSYHRDWAQWRPAYSTPCGVSQDFEKAKWSTIAPDFLQPDSMVLHTCDTGGASSGSPLLVETESGPTVIGINVGTYVQSRVMTENGQVTTRQKAETIANTAVNAAVFAPAIKALQRAVILASGAPIRDVQEKLALRGLYSSRIDGAYGAALKAAIEAYEQANNLPVTGLATQALAARLKNEPARQGEVQPTHATGTKTE